MPGVELQNLPRRVFIERALLDRTSSVILLARRFGRWSQRGPAGFPRAPHPAWHCGCEVDHTDSSLVPGPPRAPRLNKEGRASFMPLRVVAHGDLEATTLAGWTRTSRPRRDRHPRASRKTFHMAHISSRPGPDSSDARSSTMACRWLGSRQTLNESNSSLLETHRQSSTAVTRSLTGAA